MNFTDFTTKEVFEKSVLKLALIILAVISFTFGIMLALDFSKDAIVIERDCESRMLNVSSSTQTKDEVEAFLKTAIGLRFDSIVTKDPSTFMIQDIFLNRTKEQDELKKSNVDQHILVRKITSQASYFVINADRVVAVGKARSALPITLIAKISSKVRSHSNPYGLILTSVEQIKEEGKNAE